MAQKINRKNEEIANAGMESCTFKPNLNKNKFVKYPEPFKVPLGKSVLFSPDGYQPIKYIDKLNRQLNN